MKTVNEVTAELTEKVIVVGNGPLSAEQADEINNSNDRSVVHFNHAQHKGDVKRMDVLVTRNFGPIFSAPPRTVTKSSRDKQCTKTSVVPIVDDRHFLSSIWPLGLLGHNHTADTIPANNHIFPATCTAEACASASVNDVASSGAIFLSHLEEAPNVKEISVYGMNFQGRTSVPPGSMKLAHVDFKDPTLVPSHCSKCVFNETPRDTYR
jgi:hypothetical protein